MNRRDEEDKIVEGILAITKMVGSEFALINFPGRKFRISRRASYWSDHACAILFYTQVYEASRERWLDFAKGTLQELRQEVRPLKVSAL